MAVQHALRAAGLGGDRPAGEGARPAAQQDPLGGVEQLLPHVADRHPSRHPGLPFFLGELYRLAKWASAH
ncbi:hypothetical protein GCM10009558_045160 [Virgisporangium aurantiacum]